VLLGGPLSIFFFALGVVCIPWAFIMSAFTNDPDGFKEYMRDMTGPFRTVRDAFENAIQWLKNGNPP
jgi:hypothetical protein